MQTTWQDITEPGTLDDLIADAQAAGHPDINARRIHDWIAKGLLDRPRLRTRHRGSDRAEHSADQRRLLLLLLDKRQQVSRLSTLAQIPLAMWLWWDGYVPTRQAQRAWLTWVGRGKRSKNVAREGALGLLEQAGHELATPTAKNRFVRIVSDLGNGAVLTVRGRAELQDAVRDVMEPDSVFAASGLTRALGPAQIPMTTETVVGYAQALNAAVRHTLEGNVDGVLLEKTRLIHRASMADYLAQRHELAAAAGELEGLFHEPDLQEQFDQTGRQLLLTLGLELTGRRPPRRAP
ncbi:hypothetical protein PV729_48205 [Streptomyces europaeiscabiei]|uniref:Uncharacterized protein n=1 Tax=Streptomyces europaeiscabiei TaxID=146819 RepID=A0ABU4NZB4_9ACTN|nr:hypothetical protein [Streptomyces europaeiscabiei]MDX2774467.1 hypothetical protein [Streptomyces europaeiscabiei]MDX3550118.1 hypothetical protein [Streptomyces europaeiscabiei]MDX3559329.1 hypothetical protein [Streptomyces europaeiscabiei]MDX3707322.1 hypothetical protein [Streptomyces europaeiscabiei]